MKNKIKLLIILILPILCFSKAKKIDDFAFVNFGFVQSQAKNWNTGFGGHVELGFNRWGLRAFYTRVALESEIIDFIINSDSPEFDNFSTLFGMMLVRKIYLIEINNFFFVNISLGAGVGFYEKKVEVEEEFSQLLTQFNVEVTDIGIMGGTGVVGLDVGLGPLTTSCSYYYFKGLLMGEQLEKRLTLTLGFIL